ncbi:MAG: type VII secretion-associated serine protease mycosin [Mycobacterium sp.]
MTGLVPRCARIAAALLITAISVWACPLAGAVSPPLVDDSLLPPPGPPAPPRSTKQWEQCFASAVAAGDDSVGAANQLKNVDLQAVWRFTRGAGQTVAVIDTGVSRHRLLPHLVAGGDYVFTGDGTDDCDGHGTIVAGIIGAAEDPAGDDGFTGVAPDSTIIAIRQSSHKFGPADQSGPGFGDVNTMAMAVRTAADMGATVINVSSVACVAAAAALDDRALGAALAYAVDVRNAVVVAAAGNVGGLGQCPDQNPPANPAHPGRPDWDTVKVVVSPAWYDEYVLTVGSVDQHGAPSRFTLAGPWVDVAAPGEAVVSLDPDGEGFVDTLPAFGSSMPIVGTSYAAPVVSGIAALVRARSPQLTARQVMQRIEDTAHRPPAGWDPFVGYGVVDALAAVSGDTTAKKVTAETGVPRAEAERAMPPPASSIPPDPRPRRVAFGGAAICVAVAVGAVAMTTSAGRSRRQQTVTRG